MAATVAGRDRRGGQAVDQPPATGRFAMIGSMRAVAAAALAAASLLGSQAMAQTKQLTLCWAAWDPANALVELGKDFTAKTGIEMKYEFVPWTSYADRFLNELNSKGKLCDLIIGDSQWIGGAAENGHYVKLNDFFVKEGITMDDFMPATVLGYSEWPKHTPNYWALPAMGDAGRLDLSQRLVLASGNPSRI
jgi:multiple sugar transport system substrate-binding protein